MQWIFIVVYISGNYYVHWICRSIKLSKMCQILLKPANMSWEKVLKVFPTGLLSVKIELDEHFVLILKQSQFLYIIVMASSVK